MLAVNAGDMKSEMKIEVLNKFIAKSDE